MPEELQFKASGSLVLTMIQDKDLLADYITRLLNDWGITTKCSYTSDGAKGEDASGTFVWKLTDKKLQDLLKKSARIDSGTRSSMSPLSMLYSPSGLFAKGCKYCIQFYYPAFDPRDMRSMTATIMNSEDPVAAMQQYGPQFKVQRVTTIDDLKYAADKWFAVLQMQKHILEIVTTTDVHKRYQGLMAKKRKLESDLRQVEDEMLSLMNLTIKKCEKYCEIENEKLNGLK